MLQLKLGLRMNVVTNSKIKNDIRVFMYRGKPRFTENKKRNCEHREISLWLSFKPPTKLFAFATQIKIRLLELSLLIPQFYETHRTLFHYFSLS